MPPGSPNHNPIKFRAKIVLFHTRLKTRPLKSIPVFRPGFWALIKSSLLRLERKQNNSSNAFRIRVFLFPSSFGIEMKTTSIHSSSSLENNTRFQTKMCKVYSRFQTKKAQKPYPWGGTYLIAWNFRFTLISRYKKKKQNESDANNECREHNTTRKLSDSQYVHLNKERKQYPNRARKNSCPVVLDK